MKTNIKWLLAWFPFLFKEEETIKDEKVEFIKNNVKITHNEEKSTNKKTYGYAMFDACIKGVPIFRVSRSTDNVGPRLFDIRIIPIKDSFNLYFKDMPKGHEPRSVGSMKQLYNLMAQYLIIPKEKNYVAT